MKTLQPNGETVLLLWWATLLRGQRYSGGRGEHELSVRFCASHPLSLSLSLSLPISLSLNLSLCMFVSGRENRSSVRIDTWRFTADSMHFTLPRSLN